MAKSKKDFSTRVQLEGDKEYKASLGDIKSRLSVVRSELNLADAEYRKNDGSVSALTSKYDALEDQYDIQREKMGLIAEQLEKAKVAYGEDSDQVRYLTGQLNDANTAITKTEKQMDDTAEAVTKTRLENSKFVAGLGLAVAANKKLFSAAGKVAGVLKDTLVGAAVAAGAAVAGLATATGVAVKQGFELTQAAASGADDLLTYSTQTGVSTDTLQKWGYAARFVDTDVSTMTDSMAKMTQQLGQAKNGSETAAAKFTALGVNIYDSSGNLRDSEAIFMDAIDALGNVSNETERDALAMDLFGESAQDLNPLIEAGSARLNELGDEAEAAGLVMSGDALSALGGFDDAMQRFGATGEGLKNTIAAGLVPMFQPFVDTATGAMGQISAALADGLQPGELDTILQTTLDTAQTTLESLTGLLTDAIPVISDTVSGLIGIVIDALPGLLDTLLPAALSLLQSVLDAILENVEPLTQLAVSLLTQLAGFLTDNLPQLLDAATGIITSLVDGITDALPDLIPMAVTMMISLATALVEAIPEIAARLPEIVQAIFDGLQEVDWATLGTNLIQGLIDGLTSAVASLGEAIWAVFQNIWQGILDVFGIASPSTEAASAADYILQGLVQGFSDAVDAVVDTVKQIFGKIWDAIKSIFGFGGGESDESKESKQAGSDIMTGMKEGITGGEDDVKEAASNVAGAVLNTLQTQLGISEAGQPAEAVKYIGTAVDAGIAAGIDEASATAFTGAAYNTAHYVAAAFNDNMGIPGYGFSAAGSAASKYKYIGEAICSGIIAGIDSGTSRVTVAAQAMALAAFNAAKSELDINSPSKRFAWLAEMSAEGWVQGMGDRIGRMRQSVGRMTRTLTDGAAGTYAATVAGHGIDYDLLGAAVADAMAARGLGETTMVVDGKRLGATSVADGVSRSIRRRADGGAKGRGARLVVTSP
ncbi:MAG: hypothetical protein PHY64_00960 [Eubacteriales bacterium]|nr:hypothetical protein [Eubacteriales bacterium]